MPNRFGIADFALRCSKDVARSLAVSFLAIAVVVAPEVRAQAPAPEPKADQAALADAIELKNGAYLRGLILEVDPASHLTLKLPTGEVRKIPVAEIVSAERSGRPLKFTESTAPSTPAQAPAGATGTAPSTPTVPTEAPKRELDRLLLAVPGPRIKISVNANRDAYLERRIGSAESAYTAYHFVCQLPCTTELPALDPVPYRIDGDSTEATEWFQLPRYNARVRGELVSNMWPIWPRAMLVGGVLFSLVGGGMIAGWALADGAPAVRDVGIALAATGGVFFLTSGIMFLARPESSYQIERQP
jgi:hypothetical protein